MFHRLLSVTLLTLLAVTTACAPPELEPAEGEGEGEGEAAEGEGEGEGEPVTGGAIGSACACDSDCAATDGQAGMCAAGICFAVPTGPCSGPGSTAECPAGSQCWELGEGFPACWADCPANSCAGACDEDGSCAFTAATNANCDSTCATACAGGGGGTVTDPVPVATPPVPAPSTADCSAIPAFECVPPPGADEEAYCGELVFFDPRQGDGYDDYLANGETANDQYRSWVRRDVMMLVKYATAHTRCAATDWDFGFDALGLGDMSQEDGEIPGTREGDPGHPAECHERGYDMDIAYYQLGQVNNHLREVCPHGADGVEQYHCTGAPTILDPYRTVVFIAYLMDSERYLTVGVDNEVAPVLKEAATALCENGVLDPAMKACGPQGIARGGRNNMGRGLSYDPIDQDIGWAHFHHHHLHLSVFDTEGGYLPNW